MTRYTTPGAYIEWQDATGAPPSQLRTDVTGFVGLAARGPIDTPVPVESFRQFQSHFGSFIGGGFLAYAVRAFFDNGGRRCWVVRVAAASGARPPAASSRMLPAAAGLPKWRWRVAASTPGTWGDALTIAVTRVAPARTVGRFLGTSRRYLDVASVAGFVRGDLIELLQPGAAAVYRVVSSVDAAARRLYVVHPEPGAGLPYDRLLAGLDPDRAVQIASLAYSIAVREAGRPVALYPLLSPVPEHPRYGPAILPAPAYPALGGASSPLPTGATRPPPAPPPITIEELAADGDAWALAAPLGVTTGAVLALSGGAEGLADITTYDWAGAPAATADSDALWRQKTRGLRAINIVDEIAILAAPDLVVRPVFPPTYDAPESPLRNPCLPCPPPPPEVVLHQPLPTDEFPPAFSDEELFLLQSTLVQLCEERRDRVAILDAPPATADDAARGFPQLVEWRHRFDTRAAALYWPWLHVVDPLAAAPTRLVPPCGHVAGLYAQLDNEIGVHRAPANRVLAWAEDVSAAVDDERHGELNSLGVNVVRVDPGRGLRVMGARTMSSDPTWRFINVRRLVLMIMKAIDVATQWAVFEPNDAPTRGRITQALVEFLTALWRRGALQGAAAEAAFIVRCDETNNPPEAHDEGRMLAEVALAPSRPFEFVVLRLGREGNQFVVEEPGAPAGRIA
jgi:hypothetical protein